jgi:DNA-binding IclR family transcriptional regulator
MDRIRIFIPGTRNACREKVFETRLQRRNKPRKNIPTVQEITINFTGIAKALLAFLPEKE